MLKTKLKLPYLFILSLFCICVGGSIFFGVAANDVRPNKNNEQKIVAQVESWISNPSYYATSFAGGSGSETDPYLISSAEELAYLSKLFSDSTGRNNYKDKYFKQTADINLSAHPWYPIGMGSIENTDSSKSTFVATYDGDGFSISGIRSMFNSQSLESETYSHADTDDCALFYSVGIWTLNSQKENGYVKNVVIDSSTIEGVNVASIALYLNGEITNCKTTSNVSIKGNSTAAGILYGIYGSSKIDSCENRAEIICEDSGKENDRYIGMAAGIFGTGLLNDQNGYISKCANFGNVTMKKGKCAGGIGGSFTISVSPIKNCFNAGNITLSERTDSETGFDYEDSVAAGIIGFTMGKVSNCYNVGEITSSSNAAGIMWMGQAENVFNAGKMSYASEGAAIAGLLADSDGSSNLTLANAYYGGNCDDIGGMPSNSETSVLDNSTYIADLDVQAKTQEFYASYLPTFNFESIWKIDPESNNGYPVFKTIDDIIAELMEFWFEKEEYYSTNFEGSGTKTDPYLISSAKELAGLSYLVLTDNENYADKCYLQTADIDVAGKNFYPIGSYVVKNGERILAFSGHYDGGGYTFTT